MRDIDAGDRRPTKDRIGELAEQVQKLRHSNGRLTVLATFGPVIAVVLAISLPSLAKNGSGVPKVAEKPIPSGVVEVKGLVIRDDTGRIRATLGYDGEKAVGLKLYEGGVIRSEYRVWDNGAPSIGFNYFNGIEAVNIGGGGTIEPSLDMYDIDGQARVQLSLFKGEPGLSLHHTKLDTRFQLGIMSSGVPFMDFFDQDNKILHMLDKSGIPLR